MCREECTAELFFWMEAEVYKTIPGEDFKKLSARKIYGKFIAQDAKQRVRIFFVGGVYLTFLL